MTDPFQDPQSIHDPTTATSPPASWGDLVRKNQLKFAKPPGCIIARDDATVIATDTFTSVTFDEDDLYDTDAYHSTVTNADRVTVPDALGGVYWVGFQVEFTPNPTGHRAVRFVKNTSTTKILQQVPAVGGSSSTILSGMYPLRLDGGDYVRFQMRQSSGNNLGVENARAWLMWFGETSL